MAQLTDIAAVVVAALNLLAGALGAPRLVARRGGPRRSGAPFAPASSATTRLAALAGVLLVSRLRRRG